MTSSTCAEKGRGEREDAFRAFFNAAWKRGLFLFRALTCNSSIHSQERVLSGENSLAEMLFHLLASQQDTTFHQKLLQGWKLPWSNPVHPQLYISRAWKTSIECLRSLENLKPLTNFSWPPEVTTRPWKILCECAVLVEVLSEPAFISLESSFHLLSVLSEGDCLKNN